MLWTKPQILQAFRKLHRQGKDLSYNVMAKRMQPLVSAAAYHFGSYRRAVEKAGIDYAEVTRRPRWTKAKIIAVIKQARRRGEDLHWAAVTRRRDELGKSAFAALQPRLFGTWDRALHAAGLDADQVSRYRSWDRNTVLFELKSRSRDRSALNSGAVQRDDPGLYAAAMRHFNTYDAALRAAGLDPGEVRQRRRWTKTEVSAAIRRRHRSGKSVADSSVRRQDSPLYGAAVRLFGSFIAARQAAGISFKSTGSRPGA